LTAVAVFGFAFANAQDNGSFGFAKGDYVLGGNLSFSSEDNGTTKTSASTISPELSYFMTDKFSIGAGLTLGSSDNGTIKASSFSLDLGGRYYFLDLGSRFKTYTSFGVGFGSMDSGVSGAEKVSTMSFGAGLGMNYFVTSRLAINWGLSNILSYGSMKQGDVSMSSLDLDVNVFSNFFSTPSFGMVYKF
jgi:outer membrane protein